MGLRGWGLGGWGCGFALLDIDEERWWIRTHFANANRLFPIQLRNFWGYEFVEIFFAPKRERKRMKQKIPGPG